MRRRAAGPGRPGRGAIAAAAGAGRPGRRPGAPSVARPCGCRAEGRAEGRGGGGPAGPLGRLPLGALGAAGVVLGPALDEIHARANVLAYNPQRGGLVWQGLREAPNLGDDPTPFVLAQTSLAVPVLLAAFYAVDGGLYLLLCEGAEGRERRRREAGPELLSEVVMRLGVLGVLLEISAVLYENYTSYSQMRLVLAGLAVGTFWFFERPKAQGWGALRSLGLAVFAGVAAPLIETLLIDSGALWQYPRPDVAHPLTGALADGFPSWVPFCYFFYHPFLFSLARWLQDRKDGIEDEDGRGGLGAPLEGGRGLDAG